MQNGIKGVLGGLSGLTRSVSPDIKLLLNVGLLPHTEVHIDYEDSLSLETEYISLVNRITTIWKLWM